MEDNVNTLCDLCPDYADDLLGNVDQPLKVCRDESSGREFLGCDYNRDGESFRLVRLEHLKGSWPWRSGPGVGVVRSEAS